VEVVVAVFVLAVTALLVNTAPASSGANPFAAALSAEDAHVEVTVSTGEVGRNDVHVYLHTESEEAPLEASATATLPERGIGPIDLDLQPAGPGHWSAEGVDLIPAGDWRLEVTVLLTEVDEVRTETVVPIR